LWQKSKKRKERKNGGEKKETAGSHIEISARLAPFSGQALDYPTFARFFDAFSCAFRVFWDFFPHQCEPFLIFCDWSIGFPAKKKKKKNKKKRKKKK
jgi:hypothetical protein